MRRIWKLTISFLLSMICFLSATLSADAQSKKMRPAVLTEGSIPPARGVFACVNELQDKPFSDAKIEDCVATLKAFPFIRDVKVNVRESIDDASLIEFHLTGPSLITEKLAVHTFDNEESNILKFLSLSANNLHVGGIYRSAAESSTYEAITQFYRSKGTLIGAVPKVKLDYKQSKAWIEFTVVPGPTVPAHHLVPPYGEACEDRVLYVSWMNSDDGVPTELVESGLALNYPFSCFSEALAERDKAYLSNMPILSVSAVHCSGPVGNRQIDYSLKAKPLKVEQINLRGFGDAPSQLEESDPSLLKSLSLKTGDFFSHSAATKSAEYLKKVFSKDGYWAEVTVNEELVSADALRVTFSVLEFPLQTVIVDGQEVK
jgi:hypothetical protein